MPKGAFSEDEVGIVEREQRLMVELGRAVHSRVLVELCPVLVVEAGDAGALIVKLLHAAVYRVEHL